MRASNPDKLHERLITLLLIVILLLILLSSLLPFQLADSWVEFKATLLQEGKGGKITLLDLIPDFDTVTERLLIFVPFGFLIHQKLMLRLPQHAHVLSVGFVVLVALGIEIAQAVISARHSRPLDFILATTAGIVGIKLSIPIFHSHAAIRPAFNTAHQLLPGLLWLGNYLVVCICITVIISASTDISEWDCQYPLLIGNELTYDRPWQGKIRGVAIYSRELGESEIRKLSHIPMTSENITLRKMSGAIALYSFETSPNHRILIHTHAGPSLYSSKEKLDLVEKKLDSNTLHISEPLLIKSTTSASILCQAIVASQAFTVETEIASDNLKQSGPARIISNSIDLENRNFTLGEDNGDLVLRVKTPQNGYNGDKIPFKTQDNALTKEWQHVIASYADGVAKFFIDGKEANIPLHYKETLFLDTSLSPKTAFATCLLLFGMGVIAGMLHKRRPPFAAAAMSFFSTSLASIITLFSVAIWLGRQLNPIFVGAVVLIPCLGFIFYRGLRKFD